MYFTNHRYWRGWWCITVSHCQQNAAVRYTLDYVISVDRLRHAVLHTQNVNDTQRRTKQSTRHISDGNRALFNAFPPTFSWFLMMPTMPDNSHVCSGCSTYCAPARQSKNYGRIKMMHLPRREGRKNSLIFELAWMCSAGCWDLSTHMRKMLTVITTSAYPSHQGCSRDYFVPSIHNMFDYGCHLWLMSNGNLCTEDLLVQKPLRVRQVCCAARAYWRWLSIFWIAAFMIDAASVADTSCLSPTFFPLGNWESNCRTLGCL